MVETALSTIGLVNYAISGMLINIKFDIFQITHHNLHVERGMC